MFHLQQNKFLNLLLFCELDKENQIIIGINFVSI